MPDILGDVRALAYRDVERLAKKEGVWAKSAFCGQKAKFAGQKKIIHDKRARYARRGAVLRGEAAAPSHSSAAQPISLISLRAKDTTTSLHTFWSEVQFKNRISVRTR